MKFGVKYNNKQNKISATNVEINSRKTGKKQSVSDAINDVSEEISDLKNAVSFVQRHSTGYGGGSSSDSTDDSNKYRANIVIPDTIYNRTFNINVDIPNAYTTDYIAIKVTIGSTTQTKMYTTAGDYSFTYSGNAQAFIIQIDLQKNNNSVIDDIITKSINYIRYTISVDSVISSTVSNKQYLNLPITMTNTGEDQVLMISQTKTALEDPSNNRDLIYQINVTSSELNVNTTKSISLEELKNDPIFKFYDTTSPLSQMLYIRAYQILDGSSVYTDIQSTTIVISPDKGLYLVIRDADTFYFNKTNTYLYSIYSSDLSSYSLRITTNIYKGDDIIHSEDYRFRTNDIDNVYNIINRQNSDYISFTQKSTYTESDSDVVLTKNDVDRVEVKVTAWYGSQESNYYLKFEGDSIVFYDDSNFARQQPEACFEQDFTTNDSSSNWTVSNVQSGVGFVGSNNNYNSCFYANYGCFAKKKKVDSGGNSVSSVADLSNPVKSISIVFQTNGMLNSEETTIFKFGRETQDYFRVTQHHAELYIGTAETLKLSLSADEYTVLDLVYFDAIESQVIEGKKYYYVGLYLNGVLSKLAIYSGTSTLGIDPNDELYLGGTKLEDSSAVRIYYIGFFKSTLSQAQIVYNSIMSNKYNYVSSDNTILASNINNLLLRDGLSLNNDRLVSAFTDLNGNFETSRPDENSKILTEIQTQVQSGNIQIPIVILDFGGNWNYTDYARDYNTNSTDRSSYHYCTFTYIIPGGGGKSFTTSGTNYLASAQIQGTSTLTQPVKNLQLRFEQHVGDSDQTLLFTPKNDWLPEQEFTIKADAVDSSHSNNASIGKFINSDESRFGTDPGQACFNSLPLNINGVDYNGENSTKSTAKAKRTLEGFPVFLFMKFGTSEDKYPMFFGVFSFNLGRKSYYNLGVKFLKSYTTPDSTLTGFVEYNKYSEYSSSELADKGVSDVTIVEVKEDNDTFPLFSEYGSSMVDGTFEVEYTSSDNVNSILNMLYRDDKIDTSPIQSIDVDTSSLCEIISTFSTINHESSIHKKVYEDSSDRYHYENLGTWNPNSISDINRYNVDALEARLDIDTARRYLLLCFAFGLTDSLGKNLQLVTWNGGKKWYTRFYDMDTALSLLNDGSSVDDVYSYIYSTNSAMSDLLNKIDDNKNYQYKQYKNVLWTNVILDHESINTKTTWGTYRSTGGVFEVSTNFAENYFASQNKNVGRLSLNYDYFVKYLDVYRMSNRLTITDSSDQIQVLEPNQSINRINGDRVSQVKSWFRRRLNFLDTIPDLRNTISTNQTTNQECEFFFTSTSPSFSIGVTPTQTIYQKWSFGTNNISNSLMLQNTENMVSFNFSGNAQQMMVTSPALIAKLSNFNVFTSPDSNLNMLNITTLDLNNATLSVSLNSLLSEGNFDVSKIKVLNLSNIKFSSNVSAGSLDLSNFTSLQELYLENANLGSVTLPSHSLAVIKLNNSSFTDLNLINQLNLEDSRVVDGVSKSFFEFSNIKISNSLNVSNTNLSKIIINTIQLNGSNSSINIDNNSNLKTISLKNIKTRSLNISKCNSSCSVVLAFTDTNPLNSFSMSNDNIPFNSVVIDYISLPTNKTDMFISNDIISNSDYNNYTAIQTKSLDLYGSNNLTSVKQTNDCSIRIRSCNSLVAIRGDVNLNGSTYQFSNNPNLVNFGIRDSRYHPNGTLDSIKWSSYNLNYTFVGSNKISYTDFFELLRNSPSDIYFNHTFTQNGSNSLSRRYYKSDSTTYNESNWIIPNLTTELQDVHKEALSRFGVNSYMCSALITGVNIPFSLKGCLNYIKNKTFIYFIPGSHTYDPTEISSDNHLKINQITNSNYYPLKVVDGVVSSTEYETTLTEDRVLEVFNRPTITTIGLGCNININFNTTISNTDGVYETSYYDNTKSLLYNCTKLSSIYQAFNGLLTGIIYKPFRGLTSLQVVSSSFDNKDNTARLYMDDLLVDCTKFVANMSSDTNRYYYDVFLDFPFRYCNKYITSSFKEVFENNTSSVLMKSPSESRSSIVDLSGLFYRFVGVSSSDNTIYKLPGNLFNQCINLTWAHDVFSNMSVNYSLTNTPFQNNPNLKRISNMFNSSYKIQRAQPLEYLDDDNNILSQEQGTIPYRLLYTGTSSTSSTVTVTKTNNDRIEKVLYIQNNKGSSDSSIQTTIQNYITELTGDSSITLDNLTVSSMKNNLYSTETISYRVPRRNIINADGLFKNIIKNNSNISYISAVDPKNYRNSNNIYKIYNSEYPTKISKYNINSSFINYANETIDDEGRVIPTLLKDCTEIVATTNASYDSSVSPTKDFWDTNSDVSSTDPISTNDNWLLPQDIFFYLSNSSSTNIDYFIKQDYSYVSNSVNNGYYYPSYNSWNSIGPRGRIPSTIFSTLSELRTLREVFSGCIIDKRDTTSLLPSNLFSTFNSLWCISGLFMGSYLAMFPNLSNLKLKTGSSTTGVSSYTDLSNLYSGVYITTSGSSPNSNIVPLNTNTVYNTSYDLRGMFSACCTGYNTEMTSAELAVYTNIINGYPQFYKDNFPNSQWTTNVYRYQDASSYNCLGTESISTSRTNGSLTNINS